MKDFDFEAAKNGAAVCTANGDPVRILCFDAEIGAYPIVAIVGEVPGKRVVTYQKDGYPAESDWEGPLNLKMAPIKRTGYVKIGYELGVPTAFCEIMKSPDDFIRELTAAERIAKIEWEE